MKRNLLVVGNQYKTKVSGEWQIVTLTSLREDIPDTIYTDKSKKEVLVRTGAGNVIYRSPGQLKNP